MLAVEPSGPGLCFGACRGEGHPEFGLGTSLFRNQTLRIARRLDATEQNHVGAAQRGGPPNGRAPSAGVGQPGEGGAEFAFISR